VDSTEATDREPMVQRNVRVPKWLWVKAATRARREGVSLSELMRGWLRDYAAGA
jgi:predicted HicB family RNase H-like nuclease